MTKLLTDEELEQEVRSIADYLGCNEDELWSEMSKLILSQKQAAVLEFKERL